MNLGDFLDTILISADAIIIRQALRGNNETEKLITTIRKLDCYINGQRFQNIFNKIPEEVLKKKIKSLYVCMTSDIFNDTVPYKAALGIILEADEESQETNKQREDEEYD